MDDIPRGNEESILAEHNAELIRLIGAHALDRHNNRIDELISDFQIPFDCSNLQTETADYRIDGRTIQFTSIEARNRIVATYVFMERREALAHDALEWFNIAHELWRHEIGKADSAAGRLLAHIHQMSDIFPIATNAIKSKSARVFDILQAVETSLPYLEELPTDGVLSLIAAQHEGTKNDLAGGMFFNKLQEKLAGMPDTCLEIHARLRADATEETVNLYTTALVALAKSSQESALSLVLEDVESSNPILKGIALWSLGRLLTLSLVTTDSIQDVTNIIIKYMSSHEEKILQTSIRAAAYAAHTTDIFDELLIHLGEAQDQFALCAIADILYQIKNKANFHDWIRLLSGLPPSSIGAIQQFDFMLSQMLPIQTEQQVAISCFTEWVKINARDVPRDKAFTELFDSTAHQLANQTDLLSQVITDWFLSDHKQLASTAAGLLSYLWVHGLRKLEFSKARIDTLGQNDMLFLARRLVGYVISEDHLLSLTLSLLKTKDAKIRAYGVVNSLLVDEVGKDYPSKTLELLEVAKTEATDGGLIQFYSNAIEAISARVNALDTLPRLDELRPSPSLQRQFAKARAKQMSESMEEMREKSIIRKLATEIPIKAGVGFFNFRDGGYAEPTHMQSISQYVSLPMREVLDTVGYEISRFLYQNVKRDES